GCDRHGLEGSCTVTVVVVGKDGTAGIIGRSNGLFTRKAAERMVPESRILWQRLSCVTRMHGKPSATRVLCVRSVPRDWLIVIGCGSGPRRQMLWNSDLEQNLTFDDFSTG